MVLAKKKIAIQVNSHISLFHGLLLSGCDIVFIFPEYNYEWDTFMPISDKQIKETLLKHPDIYAFYLTSPSYEGLLIEY